MPSSHARLPMTAKVTASLRPPKTQLLTASPQTASSDAGTQLKKLMEASPSFAEIEVNDYFINLTIEIIFKVGTSSCFV